MSAALPRRRTSSARSSVSGGSPPCVSSIREPWRFSNAAAYNHGRAPKVADSIRGQPPISVTPPALLSNTSSRACRERSVAASPRTARSDEKSAWRNSAVPPRRRISATAAFPRPRSRPASSIQRFRISVFQFFLFATRPIPEVAPVTRQTRSRRVGWNPSTVAAAESVVTRRLNAGRR